MLGVAIFRSERHFPKYLSHVRGEGHVVGPEVSQDVDELGKRLGVSKRESFRETPVEVLAEPSKTICCLVVDEPSLRTP